MIFWSASLPPLTTIKAYPTSGFVIFNHMATGKISDPCCSYQFTIDPTLPQIGVLGYSGMAMDKGFPIDCHDKLPDSSLRRPKLPKAHSWPFEANQGHDGTRWDTLQDGFAVRLSVDHRPDNAGERRRGHLRAPAGYGEVQVRHGERVKLKHQLWGPIQPLYQYMAIDF
jgi:hypothetical protein